LRRNGLHWIGQYLCRIVVAFEGCCNDDTRPVCPFRSAPLSGMQVGGSPAGSSLSSLGQSAHDRCSRGRINKPPAFRQTQPSWVGSGTRSPRTICAPVACLRGGTIPKRYCSMISSSNAISSLSSLEADCYRSDFSYLSTIEETCLGCNSPSCSKKVANLRQGVSISKSVVPRSADRVSSLRIVALGTEISSV
jgi:hypothetical protein